MAEDKDIFDSLFTLPVFRLFRPFYMKYREVLLYLFFGGLSAIVNIGSFALLIGAMGLNELVANVIAWIVTVLFVYVTNKIWVFKSDVETTKGLLWQLASFFAGRLGTLALEEVLLFVFITKLEFNSVAVKIIAQVVVVATNYIISKLIVFRGRKNEKQLDA